MTGRAREGYQIYAAGAGGGERDRVSAWRAVEMRLLSRREMEVVWREHGMGRTVGYRSGGLKSAVPAGGGSEDK